MKTEYNLTNGCTCTRCIDCSVWFFGDDICHECGGETVPGYDQCSGECWEDSNQQMQDIIEEFLTELNNPSHLKIEASRMGWLSQSGNAIITASWSAILEALTINGEFNIDFIINEKTLTAKRYSHDEPTGARFIINAAQIISYISTCPECEEEVEGVGEYDNEGTLYGEACSYCGNDFTVIDWFSKEELEKMGVKS
jgi:hypothetical protein